MIRDGLILLAAVLFVGAVPAIIRTDSALRTGNRRRAWREAFRVVLAVGGASAALVLAKLLGSRAQ